MPQNYQFISVEDVIKFFDEEIDGMGKRSGCLRNEGVPNSLRLCQVWEFRDLTEEEFMHLTIPDHQKPLMKDKINMEFDSGLESFVNDKMELLKLGKDLPALIIRKMLPGENTASSFYIEDGAHRAITFGMYFKNNSFYKPVKAYIGTRTVE